jgi:hypothetical protein
MMDTIRVVLAISGFIGAFFFTGKAIYHTFYVVTNMTRKYASLLGPFALLMPNQFNAEGNRHRVALGPALLGMAVCWGAVYVGGAISGG